MNWYDCPGFKKSVFPKIPSGPSLGVPDVTVCTVVSAFFHTTVSSIKISISPVASQDFSFCQKYGASGLAAPVGMLMS